MAAHPAQPARDKSRRATLAEQATLPFLASSR